MGSGISYRQGVALVVTAALLWSLMGLLIRLAGDVSPWQLLFYRSVGMVPVLFAFIALRPGRNPVAAMRATGTAGLIGGAGLVVAFAGAIFAIQTTSVANAVFLFAATPLLTAVLGWLLLGERVRPTTWAAIAIALAGIFLMVRDGLSAGAGAGNLAALASAAGFATFTLTLRWGRLSDMIPATLVGALLSICVAAVVIAVRGEAFLLPFRPVALALVMGAIQLGIGLSIYTIGSRSVPAAELGILSLIEVLLGPVWVWLLLGETASPGVLVGGTVVLSAILFNTLAVRFPLARIPR